MAPFPTTPSATGIRGLDHTSALTSNFGNVATSYWSSTSGSYTPGAWAVALAKGSNDLYNTANFMPVLCVR